MGRNAALGVSQPDERVPWYVLEHTVAGDLGHLHAAHDLRELPIVSRQRLAGPVIVRAKRSLRRALHPLPEAQSTWNGASARVITFLLRQLAQQARTIESLERQVAQLHDDRRG